MAISFVACMCCVWFPWFVFLLWKRNRSWLRDGKQTTFCQRGHSSCPPEGAVNSRSLELCQHRDHPCCGARKATRQRWAQGSATQLAWGLSHLPPTLGMQVWNKPVWWFWETRFYLAVKVSCRVNLRWAQVKSAKLSRVNRVSHICVRAKPGEEITWLLR